LKIQTERLVPDHWDTCRTHFRLGRTLAALKRYDEAEGHFRSSLAMHDAVRGRNASMAETMRHLGGTLVHLRRLDEANAMYMEALEIVASPEADSARIMTLIIRDVAALFDTWSKPEEARLWRAQFEQRRAAEKAATIDAAGDNPSALPTTSP